MKNRFMIYILAGILGISSITAILISVQEPHIKTVEVDILPGSASPEQQENVSPETIKVMIGVNNTIRWNNIDDVPHTITPDHRYEGFSTGTELMKPGESYEITIEKSGEFEYHGEPHPWITGKIIALDKNGNLPTFEETYQNCPVSFMDKSKYNPPKSSPNDITEPEQPITQWGKKAGSYEEAQDFMGIRDISLPKYMPHCLKLDSIRTTTGTLGEKFLTITYLLDGKKPVGYYMLSNATADGLAIQITQDHAIVYQYNDEYVRNEAKENKHLGWDYTRMGNFAVFLKERNGEHNMPSVVDTIIKHRSITLRSEILEIDELEKIFRSMFET